LETPSTITISKSRKLWLNTLVSDFARKTTELKVGIMMLTFGDDVAGVFIIGFSSLV